MKVSNFWHMIALVGVCHACGPDKLADSSLSLGGDVVAIVGGETVRAETVLGIARRKGLAPSAAVREAVGDAVFAHHARVEALEEPVLGVTERGALARRLLEQLEVESRHTPVTDNEIEEATRRHWWEMARPQSFGTVHAVVMVPPDGKEPSNARLVASRVGRAVAGAKDADDFEQLAKAVDVEGFELRVERLPPVAADGRVVPIDEAPRGDMRFDEEFARAASTLDALGQQSAPVRSKFGYHIIRLEQKHPARILPLSERHERLFPEIIADRARARLKETLTRLSVARPVAIERSVDELTARVGMRR